MPGLGLGLGVSFTRNSSGIVGLASSYFSIVGFGDSMTAGSNASTAANRYLNILATAKGAGTPLNEGISATVLQNSNDNLGGPRADNGRDRFVADVLGSAKRHLIVMLYGFNDARWTAGGDINAANYLVDLREVMNGLVFGGYDPSHIILMNPCYITDDGLESGSAEFSGQTRVGFEAFVTNANTVGTEFGCYKGDTYGGVLAAGGADGGALIDTDNIHPTDAGHAVIANIAINSGMNANGRVTDIVTTATAADTLLVQWTAVSGATDYDVHLFLRGAFTPGLTTTASTTSISIGGLPAGEYVVRVRASAPIVYPWGFQIIPTIVGTTTPLLDTFTGTGLITAHTSDSSHTWASQPGQAAPSAHAILSGGRVRSNSSASRAGYQASVVPGSADYSVTGYITAISEGAADQVGIGGRMQGAADTYYFARYIESGGTSGFELFQRITGTNTIIGSKYTRQLRINETVKLTLSMVGTTITMLVDDVSRASGTNANIAGAGKPGFYVAGVNVTTTAGTHIENLYMV